MRRSLACAPVVVAAFLGPVLSQARDYEGYQDAAAAATPFDGIKAFIDYRTTPVTTQSAVWCGIDDGDTSGAMRWIQAGWFQHVTQGANAYVEWQSAVQYRIIWASPVNPVAEYKAVLNGTDYEGYHGSTLLGSVAASDFGTSKFCYAFFGAEVFQSPGDHTPGGVGTEVNVTSAQTRTGAGTWRTANLASMWDTAPNGHVSPTGTGAFEVWDDRD
jgi:hypothetical protein